MVAFLHSKAGAIRRRKADAITATMRKSPGFQYDSDDGL
jgi:hypothetical protein